jgi:hypothetical protein
MAAYTNHIGLYTQLNVCLADCKIETQLDIPKWICFVCAQVVFVFFMYFICVVLEYHTTFCTDIE